jgi:hypothetical protein
MVVAKNRSAQIVHRTLEVAGFPEKVVEFTSESQEYRGKNADAQASRSPESRRRLSRRKLFGGMGAAMIASLASSQVFARIFSASGLSFFIQPESVAQIQSSPVLLYPPVDLSYFETPFGYRS